MKTYSWLFLALIANPLAAHGAPTHDYVEGSVIVTFKPQRDYETAKTALGRHALKFSKHFGVLSDRRQKQTGVVHDDTLGTARLLEILKADPDVELVEPDYLRWTTAIPNDANFSNLWALQNTGQSVNGTTGTSGADMKFVPARALFRPGMTPPVVGVMDTGIDRTHPDLIGNVWVNPGETAFNNADDDGDGKIDDTYGYNFAGSNSDVTDSGYHGTHVCGTIAATGNNGIGVIGANDQARLMMLKLSTDGSTISSSAEISALQYAVLMKSRGVNLVALNASFGGGSFSTAEHDAIVAAGNAGIIMCVAAGNSGLNNDTTTFYPASYRLSNMIVVAASDQNDALASFSDYGATTVDLAAPGVNIYSTKPGTLSGSVRGGTTTYATVPILYSGTTAGITGNMVDCGIGNTGQFPSAVNGNVALIQRGTINFSTKVANAMAAGAKAAVIYNNTTTDSDINTFTLAADGNWIPACAVTQSIGASLKAALPSTTVTVTRSTDYQYLDGTSMATPQVTAAVSLAAMCFPEDTVAQRIHRILANVDTKPSLTGKVITGGRLNLQRILDSDANALPDWWEKLYFNQYTGVLPNGDADHDGLSNLNEFLAGTSPTNAQSTFKTLSTSRNPANGNMTITWSAVPGKTYQVYYSSSLASGTWSASLPGSLITTGTGQTQSSYTDTTAGSAAKRFYRVQLVTP